jgi:hypothetical protein
MAMTLLRAAAILGIGGSLLAVAVPTFVRNLSASKTAEALDGLSSLSRVAVSRAEANPHPDSFPPSVGLTPEEVPKGLKVKDPPGTWDHLTWRALDFRMDHEHAFSFRFDSSVETGSQVARFSARAHGDLDGDGNLSTFEVRGERRPGEGPRIMSGLLVSREFE